MKNETRLTPSMRVLAVFIALLVPLTTAPVSLGATFFWDTNGATAGSTDFDPNADGNWNTSLDLNWTTDSAGTPSPTFAWSGTNNTAVFSAGTDATGTSTITIDEGASITLGALTVQEGSIIINAAGGSDKLDFSGAPLSSGAQVSVALASNLTINAEVTGSVGLTKTGNGTLFLTNNSNSYTGDTVINGGAVVITNQAQLGTSTNTISINGLSQIGNPGYSGGQLVVDGGGLPATAVTMSRNISISGRGPGAVNQNAGLVSVGSNTFNGDITLAGPGSPTRITATHANTTINGTVQLGSGNESLIYGNGNVIINGQVTGFDASVDRFAKSGNIFGTTLWLTNANNNFMQSLRLDSGTVRVSTPGALGANTSVFMLDINAANLEVRSDVLDWSNVNMRKRTGTTGIILEHAIGSTLVGQSYTFGDIRLDGTTPVFLLQGRSGQGMTLTGQLNGGTAVDWAAGSAAGFQNSSNGLLTINANILRASETNARTLTFTGNGDMLMTGEILQAGTGAVSLTKAGVGTLTLQGSASTATGTTSVTNGTLSLGSFGALPSGGLLIGNATTTPGAVTYTGAGETVSKNITLNTTTANDYINSSGTGALILSGTITALAGAKTLVLGGTNTATNQVQSAIPLNATNVQKIGVGTWQLSGANLYIGTTTVSNGTLKIQDTFSGTSRDVLPNAGAIIFNTETFTQSAGGTLEYLGDGANASTESVGALTPTAGANTVMVTAGSGGTAALTFASLGTVSNGSGVNFVTNAGGSVTITGAANVNGILNAHLYFNNQDFASGSAVTAATYTAETGGASLTAGNTLPYLVNTTDIAAQATATINAGIKFNDTRNLTLAASQTLTINNGANTPGAILVTGGASSVLISGGTGITSGGTGDLVFRVDGTGDTLTLNTPITATTTGGFTKLGQGTLIVGAANANTTAAFVNINEGKVKLNPGAKLGADSVDVNLRQGATLDLNGVNLGTAASGTGSLDTVNGAGTITSTGAQASLRVGNANGGSFFTGSITGLIDLVKSGSGTFWLKGPQDYTGTVILNGGNLDVTSLANIGLNSGLGKGDATNDATNAASLVFNGGNLRYIGQNTANTSLSTQTPSVSINRLFTMLANGGIYSFGSYGQNDSRARAGNSAALVFKPVNPAAEVAFSGAGARTLTLGGDSLGDNYMGIKLVNNGIDALNITKADGGLWILGNAGNTYSGVTTISGGALQGQDGASLPTASNLFLNGGVFQSSGNFDRVLGTGADQVRWVANGNGGFAASTSKLTVDWTPLSNPAWGSTANFIAAGTLILSSSTALADVEVMGNFSLDPGISKVINATTTAGSATVNLVTSNTDSLTIGQTFTGNPNIPAGAYITAINSSTQFVLNSGTGVTAATGIATTTTAGGFRQIQVDDNGFTGMDFATVSGVISGAGGLGKSGGGILILGNDNTYTGKTVLRDGGLFVTSVGTNLAASSSLGQNTGGAASALEIGNPGTSTTANLMYVGAGETSDRQIDLVGTTGTRRIDSSGSGALILTNLNNSTTTSANTVGGDKTLELRGQNTDANMITSVLADNSNGLAANTGAFRILKTDGGVWILNATNTYTGGTRVDAGMLGIGSAASLGAVGLDTGRTANAVANSTTVTLATGDTSALKVGMNVNGTGVAYGDVITGITNATTFTISTARTIPAGAQLVFGGLLMSNGGIFATDPAGLTLTQPIIMNNGTTAVFGGLNAITLSGDIIKNSGTSDAIVSNNLEGGALLTVDGDYLNFQNVAGTRLLNIRGYGSTVWNGDIKDNALLGTSLSNLNIAIDPTATFTLAGGSSNTYTGGTTLTDGILILDKAGALGTGTFAFNGGTLRVGATPASITIANALQINASPPKVDGTKSITFTGGLALGASRTLQNELTGGALLTISGTGITNTAASTLTLTGSGDTVISADYNAGTGANSLALSGPGTLLFTGTSSATGTLSANNGTLTLSGSTGGSWNAGNVAINGNGVLTLDNSAGSGGENAAGRLNNAGTVTMSGGVLDFIGDGDGTSEATGALTVNTIMATINVSSAGGSNTLSFTSANLANSGSSLDLLSGITGLGSINKVKFSVYQEGGVTFMNDTTLANSQFALPRISIAGDFAAYDPTNGVVAFTAYDSSNNLNPVATLTTATGTRTNASPVITMASTAGVNPGDQIYGAGIPARSFVVSVDSGTQVTISQNATSTATGTAAFTIDAPRVMNLTSSTGLSANSTLEALKINGTGLNIGTGSATNSILTLTTGSVLNTGGNNTLSIPQITTANGGVIQVDSGTQLTVTGAFIGGGQINKTGAGEVIYNAPQFQASTYNLSAGKVTLGGDNYLFFPGIGQLTLDTGATLEVNGNVQYIGALAGPAAFPNAGGTVQNTGGLTTFVTNGGGAFGGLITGAIDLGRIGGGTLTLEIAQTYTGGTALIGGTTTLRDNATLLTTSAIEINQASLLLRNNDNLQIQINDRINDATPITLRGGTIDVNGRISTAATETMGALTVLEGANVITSTTGGGTITSATLTFASLTRSPGATINFTGSGALGAIGNLPKILFTSPLSTVGTGALGAWAIANSTDYAAYNVVNGVGVAGTGGFVGYTPDFATGNITNVDGGARAAGVPVTLPGGTTNTGMLRLGGKAINDIVFSGASPVLNLGLGGLLRQDVAFSSSIGTSATRGVLTAGGAEVSGTRELVIYVNTSTQLSFGGTGTTIGVGATQVTLASTGGLGLQVGMQVSNANYPVGTTITAIDNYNLLTLSNPSTNGANATNQTFTTGVVNLGTQNTGSPVVTMATTVGIAPGMTITGTGIPAGTFVSSVDSATQLTLSQAATTTVAGTAAYTLGMTNMIVNSVIANNGSGNSVQLVKSGSGVLNLSAANTYTGGTIVDQGTLNLVGDSGTVVIPAGGLTVTGAAVVMNTNQGQIDPSNTVTLNGSSTVTLVGNNTLNSIVFNNNGGTGNPTFNVGGILTLTNSAPVTVTTNNAATLPLISGGTIDLGSGVKTFAIGAPTLFGDEYHDFRSALEISSAIIGTASIVKGSGLLELSGQSTFTGGITATSGGIVLGASSTTTFPNGLISGPLGLGTLSMSAGTTLLVDDSSRAVANPISWTGSNPILSNTGTSTDTMTLNGALTFSTLATTGLVVDVDTPYLNVVLGGPITGIGSVTSVGSGSGANTITKTGLGNITGLNLTGIGSSVPITLQTLTNNSFSLLHDGDATSGAETINLGNVTWNPVNNILNLSIGRAGTGVYYPTPAYKTINLAGFTSTNLPNGLILTNNNAYGLVIPDAITLAAGNSWSVSAANTSLQPAGLTLTGKLSGVNGLTKVGNGTLKLGNTTNDFTGTIDITNGTVEGNDDLVFGNAANVIQIGSNSLAEGLRISGNVTTSRVINLNAASSGIDVTGTNTLTLNSAFTFATATNALRKNDTGTLVLTQAQPGWDGVLTIGQGVLRITDGAALGSTTGNLIIANVGAGLELPGGVTVADPIFIASTDNSSANGPNAAGAIRSTGGTNTITGAITIATTDPTNDRSRSGTLTADFGSTLDVTGGIVLGIGTAGSNRDNWVGFGGVGTINLTTTGITHTGNLANGIGTLTKFGSGTLNIQVANALSSQRAVVKSGTLSLNGAGTLGVPGAGGGTGDVYLNPTGLLVLDNSGTPVDNRLSGRNINVSGADLSIIGNSGAATNETVGTFTLREGTSYFTFDADLAQQLNFTSGTVTRTAQSTLVVRGDNLGSAAGAGVATIKGGAYVFIGQLGDTGTTNKSILPWAYGDTDLVAGEGTFFLTADSVGAALDSGVNILRPLSGAEQTTDFSTALANVNLTTTVPLTNLNTYNSLRLDSGGGVILNYVPLTLDSGGLMVLGLNTGITGYSGVSYLATTSNREINLHAVGNLSLGIPIISGTATGGTGGALTKSGPGMLTLTAANTSPNTVMVNDGTLKLGAGNQTILPGRNMWVNEGGVLDLNDTVQQVNFLESRQSAVLARNDSHFGGGIVMNSGGSRATLVMATASSIFAGSIQGNIAVVRSTAANATTDWNLYVDQPYTGPTLYNGGRVLLADTASLSGTTSIEISNANLYINASNNTTEASNTTNRINDAATITLRGGMLTFRNRAAIITTESFGDVILGEGASIIDFAEGGSAVNQADATFLSLARAGGSHATVHFLNMDGAPSAAQRLFITTLNGSSTATIGGGLTNNIIGGWALASTGTGIREFASYIPGQGVAALNTQGYAGYAPAVNPNLGTATDNIRIVLPVAGSTTTLTGNVTLNSLNMQAPTNTTGNSILDLGGNTLTLASGGLILSPVATTALTNTITVQNGSLTAGTTAAPADLYLNALQWFNGQADTTGNADVIIDSPIVNNGAGGAVTLVISGATGRGSLAATNDVFLNGSNTYTGGTFVNSGQVRLNNGSADGTTVFAIPGDLTITGGYGNNSGALFNDRTSTVILNAASQIKNTATVTIMGGAILNLNNFNQTIANLVFNNHGGTIPQVTTGTGTLTVSGSTITATSQNASSNAFSTVNGNLALGAATTTFDVDRVEWNNGIGLVDLNPILPTLLVNAIIQGGNIVKTGSGLLRLSGANLWTGNMDLQTGGLSFGNNAALSTGSLTIGDDTFLTSNANGRILTNNFSVSGDFALRDQFTLTLSGAGTLAVGNHNIGVDQALNTLTLSGVLSGASANLEKSGDGILVLANSGNTYGGATQVSDGVLRYGAVNAVPTGSATTVLAGGFLDITAGGSSVTVGSIAGNSATTGGVVFTYATSGTATFTAGANNTSTAFGGTIANNTGSTLNFVKTGSGALTLGGTNLYTGNTVIEDGRIIVVNPLLGGNALGSSGSLILGGATLPGVLQLGDGSGAHDESLTSLATQGTSTTNRILGGNASASTITLNLAGINTFAGNFGGGGLNENNLNVVKSGVGDLSVTGTGLSIYNGTTTVNGGKLLMDTVGAFPTTTTSLTVADGAFFALRGNTGNTVTPYGFSGGGAVLTVGSATGATLGFGIDGALGVDQLSLATGQTLGGGGTLTTAVFVNGTPTSGNQYVLINAADAGAITGFPGTLAVAPVVFNGGSFTYALASTAGVNGGGLDQWTLTPTAAAAAADTWWKGDLGGIATGIWSATVASTSNWSTLADGVTDTVVAPDLNSSVHFEATGAANFATTLGANMTIQDLTFHTGNTATTIGNSYGANTLTLGNGTDTPFLTIQTGAADVGVSATVALPQNQSWNIEDLTSTLTLSGGLTGTSRTLTVNDNGTATGALKFEGTAATMTGTLAMNAGTLIFSGTGSLNSGLDVVLGTGSTAATIQVGNAAAINAIIGGLSNGAFAGSKVVGSATGGTITVGPASGSKTFSGALGGGGANENNFSLEKAGAGTQIVDGAATYTGSTTVREGVLQLGSSSTFAPTGALSVIANAGATAVMDVNGKSWASSVGNLTFGGADSAAAAYLNDTATGGLFTLGGDLVYDATNNPMGATINANLNGGIAARVITVNDSSTAATDLTFNGTLAQSGGNLTLAGAGNATINSAWTLSTGNLAITFNSTGTWTINAPTNTTGSGDWNINTGVINANVGNALNASDNVIIDGTGFQSSAIVNIGGSAGGIGFHQGNNLYIRNGARVNVLVNNGVSTGTNQILVGDTASVGLSAAAVLNLASANINIGGGGLLIGTSSNNIGNVIGSGIITTAGTYDLRNGSIASGIVLSGTGSLVKQILGTLTFSGRSTGTGNTFLYEGNLILDYTTTNLSKINGVFTLGQRADVTNPTMTINGSAAANTIQSVVSTTVAAGTNTLSINRGGTQTATLNLGAFTRLANNDRGVVNFEYSSGSDLATSTSPAGVLGWATLAIGAGPERVAAIDGSGNIVQVTQTTQNNAALWSVGQDIINSGAYTGTVTCADISSLTFAAAAASTVTVGSGGHLILDSGAIVVDPAVGVASSVITGGTLLGSSATGGVPGEVIVHQNNTLGTLTIASRINTTSGLTKSGNGMLILSGNNVYLGTSTQVTVNEGTLRLAGGKAIGDTTEVYIRRNAILDLNGTAEVIGNLKDESSGTIALGTGGAITITPTVSTDYRGVFTGSATSSITLNALGFNLNVTAATTTGFTGSVVVNSGLLQLSGSGRLANASGFTINKGGNLLIDDNGTTLSGDRILNTATIMLNSADGTFGGQTQPRGLAIRTDQGATLDETVGVVTANSGANYVAMEATTADDDSDIIMANLVRANNGTLDVRGTNLGSTAAQNNQFRIGTAANETAFVTALVGGAGAAGTKTISIVPWAIGETTTGALVATNMGNSLVTYVTGAGIRPLDFATEYSTFAGAGGATDNVRESLTTSLTALPTQTVNSLVINNNNTAASSISVSGNNAGEILTVTSGAILFTQNTGATANSLQGITLDGYTGGIAVGGGNEYIIHVVNPSSAANTAQLTATIASNLTSTADITKSGRGTLVLTGANTAGGNTKKTTLNEGVLEISDLDNIGGNTGALAFGGGTLRLASGYGGDDLSSRTITFLSGGGTIDTNGNSLALAASVGSGIGGLTKAGTGTLTLNAAATYSGVTTISGGTLAIGANNALGTGDIAVVGNGTLALGTNSLAAALFSTSGLDPVITGTGTITASQGYLFNNTDTAGTTVSAVLAGPGSLVKNQANNLTLNGANTYSGGTYINGGTITVGANNATGTGEITVVGNGTLALGANSVTTTVFSTAGVDPSITGTGTITSSGGFFFNNTDTFGTSVSAVLAGLGDLCKHQDNVLTLNGVSTYTGATGVNAGTLALGATGSINGTSAVTVSSGATLSFAGNHTHGAAATGQITVLEGGTLSLQDGAINTLTLAPTSGTSLTLGSASSTSALLFDTDFNTNSVDLIAVGQNLLLNAGGTTVSLNDLSGILANNTYTLATYLGTSTLGTNFTFTNGATSIAVSGTQSYTLDTKSNQLDLIVGTFTAGAGAYFKGSKGVNWNVFGPGSNTNWVNAPNGVDPFALPTSTQDVYLSADTATNLATVLGADFSIKGLIFTGTGTSGIGGASVGGSNTLTIGINGITVQSGAGASGISADLVLDANQTWTNSSSNLLTVSSPNITATGGGKNLTIDGTGNTTISGLLNTGTGNLVKNGTGTAILSGDALYTGTTAVNLGILRVENSLTSAGGTITIDATTPGTTLEAYGTIQRTIVSSAVSTNANITAIGDLNIGNITTGINFLGQLNVGTYNVGISTADETITNIFAATVTRPQAFLRYVTMADGSSLGANALMAFKGSGSDTSLTIAAAAKAQINGNIYYGYAPSWQKLGDPVEFAGAKVDVLAGATLTMTGVVRGSPTFNLSAGASVVFTGKFSPGFSTGVAFFNQDNVTVNPISGTELQLFYSTGQAWNHANFDGSPPGSISLLNYGGLTPGNTQTVAIGGSALNAQGLVIAVNVADTVGSNVFVPTVGAAYRMIDTHDDWFNSTANAMVPGDAGILSNVNNMNLGDNTNAARSMVFVQLVNGITTSNGYDITDGGANVLSWNLRVIEGQNGFAELFVTNNENGLFADTATTATWKNTSANNKWTQNDDPLADLSGLNWADAYPGTQSNPGGGFVNGGPARFDGTADNFNGGVVDVDGVQTLTRVILDKTGTGYTIGSTGVNSLNLTSNSTGTGGTGAGAALTVISGDHTINTPIFLANTAGNSNVYVNTASSLTLNGRIGNATTVARPLIKIGAGTLTLTGANTYSGQTSVNAGTLLANNTSGSATGSGAVVVGAAGTLGGSGRIAPALLAAVTINGSLAPGSPGISNGIGKLTVSPEGGNMVFGATGTANFELLTNGTHGYTPTYNMDGTIASLSGTYVSGGNDQLSFQGGALANKVDFTNLAAGNFNVTFAGGYTPAANDIFDLLDWANLTGSGALNNEPSAITGLSVAQLDLPTLPGALVWDTSQWTGFGVVGIYLVPEPSRMLLMFFGLAALFLRRRRNGSAVI